MNQSRPDDSFKDSNNLKQNNDTGQNEGAGRGMNQNGFNNYQTNSQQPNGTNHSNPGPMQQMNGSPNNGFPGPMPPNHGYPNNLDPYHMPYSGARPRLQILHDNPEISDFDQLSLKPKSILSWVFFSLFILAVVVLGVSNLISVAVDLTIPKLATSDWYTWVVTFISLVLFGLPIFYLLLKRIPDSPKGKIQPLKLTTFIVIFFICAAAMYITNMFSVMIVFLLSILKGQDIINPLNEVMLNGNFLITMIYAAFIAPIVEEIIFRGLLLSKLRRFGDIPAILFSGLAFGCFHFNLSQFFYAAVLGFIFAYVTIRTNTIKYSVILHVMINFIASAVTPLIAGGNIFATMILSVWVFASIIIGIVFFALSIKKIRLEKGTKVLNGASYFLNTGVVLYTAISIAMIVVSIVIS